MKEKIVDLLSQHETFRQETPQIVYNRLAMYMVSATVAILSGIFLLIFSPVKTVALFSLFVLIAIAYFGVSFYVSYRVGNIIIIQATCEGKNDYRESLTQKISSMMNRDNKMYEYQLSFNVNGEDGIRKELFYLVLPELKRMKAGIKYEIMFFKVEDCSLSESNLVGFREVPVLAMSQAPPQGTGLV